MRVTITKRPDGAYEAGLICGDGRFGLVCINDTLLGLCRYLQRNHYKWR